MRNWLAPCLALVTVALVGAAAPSAAAAETKRPVVSSPTDVSSQTTRRRARTRITVTPGRRAGKLVRECDFRLVREVRASGTYVVPHQRCWWTRQR